MQLIEVACSFIDLSESLLRLAELCSTLIKLSDHLRRHILFAINYCLFSVTA